MKKRAVIISGGNIEEDFALRFLDEHSGAVLIAADAGLCFLRKYGRKPAYIVGDFDSADEALLAPYREDPEVTIRRLQPEKDWTDTEIAAEQALELGCEELYFLGATGGRLDHTLGNIQLLALLRARGADGYLLDPSNRVYLKDQEFTVEKAGQWGTYLSLFAYGGEVTGLTLEGVKYPVENFTLGCVGTRGVSNEITGNHARIRFTSGKLLVVEARD